MDYKFLMIDGPDGAGKGVVLSEIVNKFDGKKFDLAQYWKQNNGDYPTFYEADVILSAEPTYSLQGLVIRNELIKKGNVYPVSSIAQAYALDRQILYNKIIIPALQKGIKIIQDRGISSSLVYQQLDAVLKGEDLTINDILAIEGNKLAMKYPPSHLVIVYAKPELLIQRLNQRQKKDDSIFENLDFQSQLTKAYLSRQFKQIFEEAGTKIIYLENSSSLETLKSKISELMQNELDSETKV